jgi:mannose/fructose-specific phosphotransferase system component IIA
MLFMSRTGAGRVSVILGMALPLLLGACTSQDSTRQALDAANAAKAQADAAQTTAQQAVQVAQAANAKADKAEADAQAVNDKTDQMFQRSLRKR